MAWNAPGNGGGDKDPWRGNSGGGQSGPPELDEMLKKLQERLGGRGGSGGGSGSLPGGMVPLLGIGGLLLVAFYLWWAIFQVDAQEEAVIFRLGKYQTTVGPGLHMHFPPFDKKVQRNVTRTRSYHLESHMLTRDENIVDLSLTVQFFVKDLKDSVLNLANAESALEDATQSALRHEVGGTDMNSVLTDGQEELQIQVKERLQDLLDDYGSGLQVVQVSMRRPQAPKEVQNAFDDVVRAKEDRERLINEARAYENAIVLEAEGKAQRMLEDAEAYKIERTERSEGEASRFTALQQEYAKAPVVTRERMYLETLQQVYGDNPKVMVDVESGNSMFYLPIDKLLETQGQVARRVTPSEQDRETQEEKRKSRQAELQRSSGRTARDMR
jgi:membrane protease subunit HflK